MHRSRARSGRISPPRESTVFLGPGFFPIVAHEGAARQTEGASRNRMPFALLALLLVMAVVAVVLLVFFLVRRWL